MNPQDQPTAEELASWCRGSDGDDLLRDVLTVIGDTWTVLVIGALTEGPLRFGRLQERVPAISHRMLTRTLRTLERNGLVTRTVYPESPPRVDYALTDLGRTLLIPLAGLRSWVQRHRDTVRAHRKAYDA